MIAPCRCITEDTLPQWLLPQILQAAPLQRCLGKQGPAQNGRPGVTVQDHLTADPHGIGNGHQRLFVSPQRHAAIAEQLHREVTIVAPQAPGHGIGLQQPGQQGLGWLTLCGHPPGDELDQGNSQLGLHSFTIRRFPLSG